MELVYLKSERESEFDLAGSAERVDPRADPDAVNVVSSASCAVDLSCRSRQQSVQCSPWQIKVREIK